MNILLSNDDGFQAPGICALAEALSAIGEVTIVAPDRNRSGASNSLTLSQPVVTNQEGDAVFSVQGTPTDCVQIAFGGLLKADPDIVVSGINDGPNMGDDTLYSGTVAAAMEGRFLKYSPVAVSMGSFAPRHYQSAANVVKDLISTLSPSETNVPHAVLNVNVPDLPLDAIKGFRSTVLGSRHAAAPAIAHESPRGETLYWLGPAGLVNNCDEGTDFHAIEHGYVSVTALKTDLTDHALTRPLQDWLDKSLTGTKN